MKRKGICSVCGCTEEDACEEGCSWANRAQNLCSACKPLNDSERAWRRARSLEDLRLRLGETLQEAKHLQLRMVVLGVVVGGKAASRS